MTQVQGLKQVTEEVAKTFEALKDANEKAIADADKRHGQAAADLAEKVETINASLTELREEQAKLQRNAARPNIRTGDRDAQDPEAQKRLQVFEKYVRYGAGETGRALMDAEEQRALSGLSDSEGGFLVPAEIEPGIIMKAYDLAEIRPYCQVGSTGRDVVQLGTLSKPTVAWGRANVAVTDDDIDAGVERIRIYPLRALTLIHVDTLDDAEADIIGEIEDAFSRAIAEAEDDAFAAGAGDDSPQGIAADSRVQSNYAATGVAAALSDASNNGTDALIGVMYTPKKTYRRNGTWAMNSTTEASVRKLKNGEGQYIWAAPVSQQMPATLFGRPVINPEGLPDVAAGAFPVIFGDFRAGYKIRDRAGLTIQRLVERYAEYDQTGILIKRRVGGQVTLPEAFACLKVAAS